MQGALIESGWWVQGLNAGRGVAVATPQYVAFIPTERSKNLAGEVAWGVAGFVTVGATKIPPERVIAKLANGPLDAQVAKLIAGLSGRRWDAGSATIRLKKILLRPSKRGLWFNRGNESIRFGRAVPLDELERHRATWTTWKYE